MDSNMICGDVSLRSYSHVHHEKTVDWLNKEHLQQTFCMLQGITIAQHRRWLEQNREVLKWAIYNIEEYEGNLFCFINNKHRSACFQIYLGEVSSFGKGIGKRAMTIFLNHAFNQLGLHRIWMHCFLDNIRAVTMYESLGFHFEGLERESLFVNGQYRSQGRWSLLEQEWNR